MARILLVNPPMLDAGGGYVDGYQGVRPRLPPLGLACLGAVLEKEGHEVRIIDGMAEIVSAEGIAEIAVTYDAVGITSITFLALLTLDTARAVKKRNPKIPVIVGGPHASVVPAEVLSEPAVDYVVIGEAERTLPELLTALALGQGVERVKGIAYREGGDVRLTPDRPLIEHLDSLPLPARHLLPMSAYRASEVRAVRHPALHMMSSRGCPFRCSFCSSETTHRCKLRLHSAERVVEEMELLIRDYGAREIHFWDDCFVFDEERVFRICELIRKRDLRISWDCEATVNTVTRPMLRAMKRAGCHSLSYGVETGTEERYRAIGKGFLSRAKIREVVALTRSEGLRARGYFMFGFPGETRDEMEETLRFSTSLKLDFATYSLLIPLPGTRDYARAREEATFDPFYWRTRILSEISFPKNAVYVPRGTTEAALLEIHRRACRDFYFRPTMVLKRLLSLRSPGNLWGLLKGARFLFGRARP